MAWGMLTYSAYILGIYFQRPVPIDYAFVEESGACLFDGEERGLVMPISCKFFIGGTALLDRQPVLGLYSVLWVSVDVL